MNPKGTNNQTPAQSAKYGKLGKLRSPWRFGIPGIKKKAPRPAWVK
jgi:hypothetical protein